MYNGVGLQTPRGSGTNGYIQKSMAFLKPKRTDAPADEFSNKEIAPMKIKSADKSLLEHERKRKIEIDVFKLRQQLTKESIPDDEIEKRATDLRKMLLQIDNDKLVEEANPPALDRDSLKALNTHEIAALKEKEMEIVSKAFNISPSTYKPGSAFDFEAKRIEKLVAKEKRQKEEIKKEKKLKRIEKAMEYEKNKRSVSSPSDGSSSSNSDSASSKSSSSNSNNSRSNSNDSRSSSSSNSSSNFSNKSASLAQAKDDKSNFHRNNKDERSTKISEPVQSKRDESSAKISEVGQSKGGNLTSPYKYSGETNTTSNNGIESMKRGRDYKDLNKQVTSNTKIHSSQSQLEKDSRNPERLDRNYNKRSRNHRVEDSNSGVSSSDESVIPHAKRSHTKSFTQQKSTHTSSSKISPEKDNYKVTKSTPVIPRQHSSSSESTDEKIDKNSHKNNNRGQSNDSSLGNKNMPSRGSKSNIAMKSFDRETQQGKQRRADYSSRDSSSPPSSERSPSENHGKKRDYTKEKIHKQTQPTHKHITRSSSSSSNHSDHTSNNKRSKYPMSSKPHSFEHQDKHISKPTRASSISPDHRSRSRRESSSSDTSYKDRRKYPSSRIPSSSDKLRRDYYFNSRYQQPPSQYRYRNEAQTKRHRSTSLDRRYRSPDRRHRSPFPDRRNRSPDRRKRSKVETEYHKSHTKNKIRNSSSQSSSYSSSSAKNCKNIR